MYINICICMYISIYTCIHTYIIQSRKPMEIWPSLRSALKQGAFEKRDLQKAAENFEVNFRRSPVSPHQNRGTSTRVCTRSRQQVLQGPGQQPIKKDTLIGGSGSSAAAPAFCRRQKDTALGGASTTALPAVTCRGCRAALLGEGRAGSRKVSFV